MGNWNQILLEINKSNDDVRREYLAKLYKLTRRNTVCYYSGWLQKTDQRFVNTIQITDEDKAGFMSCFHQLDRDAGLDLIIHSPGGIVTAAESLIHYLRECFADNIRVFVPQSAMSGGTLMALAAREIWMGKHSNLGPIDPQFGHIPAVTLLDEVKRAYKEIQKDPGKAIIWAQILSQISPSFLTQAQQAIDLSRDIAVNSLTSGMFKGAADGRKKALKVARALTNANTHKQHGRHIHAEACERLGLNIKRLEDDPKLQDAVLSVHHAFMITLANTPAGKIIENHRGSAFVKSVSPGMLAAIPTMQPTGVGPLS